MSKKDLPKIFLRAFKKTLDTIMPGITYHEFGTLIERNSKKGIVKAHTNTINEFLSHDADSQLSTLEKILLNLNDDVFDEALDLFIDEFKNLLIDYRKKNSLTNADLEDAALGGSQGKKN
jgi:hypothetical protein